MTDLLKTTYTIFHPNGAEKGSVMWPKAPGWIEMERLLMPLIFPKPISGQCIEHIYIMGATPGDERLDMFVDEISQLRDPKPTVNTEATRLYRRMTVAKLERDRGAPPSQAWLDVNIPDIRGIAVVFDRRVWW